MATPNDPDPPKKPNPSVPPGKPPSAPSRRSGVQPPAKPGRRAAAGRPAKPAAEAAGRHKPPAARPPRQAAGQRRPPPRKPSRPTGRRPSKPAGQEAAPRRRLAAAAASGDIGQVLIDLGFIDDDQLWEILDEAKNTGLPIGQVAVGARPHQRGPAAPGPGRAARPQGRQPRRRSSRSPRPSQLVPETMADVYKSCRCPSRTRC